PPPTPPSSGAAPYTPAADTRGARSTPYPAPGSRAADTASTANAERLRRRFEEQADAARRRREADRTNSGER
ncbi:hypothetical protein, partial [Streptomyces sp. WM4235]|uniref:hypothetical protein n=1 Tax=Streptomyces sp. WM4235 TaxID=1415551 RepID=UPI000A46CEC9